MNFLNSSNASNPSEELAKPGVAATRGPRERQWGKDQDLPLKLRVASALATSGYYARISVALSATSARGLADVTDVDVFAVRYDPTFSQIAIAVTCKSGVSKTLSPAREIFYLRGVLDYVKAESGVAAFLRKPVPSHLRDLGRRLDVLVLSGEEIEQWCQNLTNGLPDLGFFQESAYDEYQKARLRLGNSGLTEYLHADYWFHLDFRNLQNLIGHTRKVSAHLNSQHSWHNLIVLDVAAHLCLTVFDLCRQIRMLGLSSISETTAAYLFGGATSFKARRDLYGKVQQLLASTGVVESSGPSLPPLEPAYTEALAELAIRFIERPHAAILVPQVIQDSFWRHLGASGTPPLEDKNSLAAEKLAQDLLDFLKFATGGEWTIKL
jgi:hypothetical protein